MQGDPDFGDEKVKDSDDEAGRVIFTGKQTNINFQNKEIDKPARLRFCTNMNKESQQNTFQLCYQIVNITRLKRQCLFMFSVVSQCLFINITRLKRQCLFVF